MDSDRKGQAHRHAAGVGLYRLINEVADFGKRGDVGIAALDLFPAEPENGRVQIDIFASCEFGIESGAEFEQGGDPAEYSRLA